MLTLYENIRKLRLEKSMSQQELARLTGYTDRSSIAKIEKGEVDLTLSKIELFAKALGVKPGELMGWEAEYSNFSLNPIGKLTSEDVGLVEAYHNAHECRQEAVRTLLDMGGD